MNRATRSNKPLQPTSGAAEAGQTELIESAVRG